ncbi:hypothetical protein SMMN14_05728 [Sphaerulina musiva]
MPSGLSEGNKIVWDDAADRKFLMAIIKAAAPTLPKFADVAAIIGNGVTASALSSVLFNRWAKLKKQIEGTGEGRSSAAPSTPSKPKSTPSKAKGTPRSARKRKAKDMSENGDDEEEMEEKVGEDEKAPSEKKVKIKEQPLDEDEDEKEEWLV